MLKYLAITALSISAVSLCAQNIETDSSKEEKVTTILQTLDAFQKQHPNVPGKTMKVVYFCPKGTHPHPGYQKRLTDWMDDFEDFYKKEMRYHGFGNHYFSTDRDSDGSVHIYHVTGKNVPDSYSYREGGYPMCFECRDAIKEFNLTQESILLVNNKPFLRNDNVVRINSPFYGAYNGEWGCGWAIDYPEITIQNLENVKEKITYSEHDWVFTKTKSEFAITYIGGAIHELGHAWGLPHDCLSGAEAKRGESLMSSGNYAYRANRRNPKNHTTVLSFADAVQLVSHPLFSGHAIQHNIAPRATGKDIVIRKNADTTIFEGNIASNLRPYALILYVDPKPWGFSNDYDATAHVAVVNEDGSFKLFVSNKCLMKECEVTIRVCFVNGRTQKIPFAKHFKKAIVKEK